MGKRMGRGLSRHQVTLALVALTAAAVGLTVYMHLEAHHAMQPVHYAPAVAMAAILVAWPFANGWRPFIPAHRRLRACPACGVEWLPDEADGKPSCPACGT